MNDRNVPDLARPKVIASQISAQVRRLHTSGVVAEPDTGEPAREPRRDMWLDWDQMLGEMRTMFRKELRIAKGADDGDE